MEYKAGFDDAVSIDFLRVTIAYRDLCYFVVTVYHMGVAEQSLVDDPTSCAGS